MKKINTVCLKTKSNIIFSFICFHFFFQIALWALSMKENGLVMHAMSTNTVFQ